VRIENSNVEANGTNLDQDGKRSYAEIQKRGFHTRWRCERSLIFVDYLVNLTFHWCLKFGYGLGSMTKLIMKHFKTNSCVAFDMSPHQIENARKKCPHRRAITMKPPFSKGVSTRHTHKRQGRLGADRFCTLIRGLLAI